MKTEIFFNYVRGIVTGAVGGATFAAIWHLYKGGRDPIICIGILFCLLLVLFFMFVEIICKKLEKKK